jgi:hypothetical protein
MLADVINDLERIKPPASPAAKGTKQSGEGSSAGKGNSAKGQGQEVGEGQGGGKSNAGAGDSGEGKKKSDQRIADLEKELSNTRTEIANESAARNNPIPKPQPGQAKGRTLAAGENPNQPGSANQPNAKSQNEMPKPANEAAQTERTGQGGKGTAKNDKGSTSGDTHLGQFPEPIRYERYYKPGEHGPPIEIRDARYVVFRLPSAATSAGEGKIVTDTRQPEASTPYSNVPLKAERLEAAPEERQLVPPRYRELIQ